MSWNGTDNKFRLHDIPNGTNDFGVDYELIHKLYLDYERLTKKARMEQARTKEPTQSTRPWQGFYESATPDASQVTAYREWPDGTSYILTGGRAVFVPR